MLSFYFEYSKAPNRTKKFEPLGPHVLEIWESRVSTFSPFPKKLGGHIPSIFCTYEFNSQTHWAEGHGSHSYGTMHRLAGRFCNCCYYRLFWRCTYGNL